jgi:hypothetical protein
VAIENCPCLAKFSCFSSLSLDACEALGVCIRGVPPPSKL